MLLGFISTKIAINHPCMERKTNFMQNKEALAKLAYKRVYFLLDVIITVHFVNTSQYWNVAVYAISVSVSGLVTTFLKLRGKVH